MPIVRATTRRKSKSVPTRRKTNRCRALILVDNGPIQKSAWALLQRARKRLARATGEVHRHDEVDEPAFRAWISATFPTQLTTLREVRDKLLEKARIVQAVEEERTLTGRPAAQIWREWKRNGGLPPEASAEEEEPELDSEPEAATPEEEEMIDEAVRNMCAGEGIDEDSKEAKAFREFVRDQIGLGATRNEDDKHLSAREIYRRLVLLLHPDRGGEWTIARARLWDQVQRAWANRDVQWLSRLEAEWESSADILGPTSPVSRLKLALREIEAARRDAESRVVRYRREPSWRFSDAPPTQGFRDAFASRLRAEIAAARRDLDSLEQRLARWERSPGMAAARGGF